VPTNKESDPVMSTVETIRFHLREGVEDADFVRRNHTVETEYMMKQRGFVSRETARSDDGEWFVAVHWASIEAAEATMGAFFGAPQTQDFLDAVDKSTVQSARYEVIDSEVVLGDRV
jgi:hypothetical protein